MTDMEGVCGVKNFTDWVTPEGKHYLKGKQLLTAEVNAAAQGFFAGGATEVHVVDGHGYGGIDPSDLDPRITLRERLKHPAYPLYLNEGYDCICFVGQHAKSRTPFAQMPHSGDHNVISDRINGTEYGEFGVVCMCAEFYHVPCIFASGDLAFTREAKTICPNIHTVAVKRGLVKDKPEDSDMLCGDDYIQHFIKAKHLSLSKARQLIAETAEKALRDFIQQPEKFYYLDLPRPPYFRVIEYRDRPDGKAYAFTSSHPEHPAELFNAPPQPAYPIRGRGYMNKEQYQQFLKSKTGWRIFCESGAFWWRKN